MDYLCLYVFSHGHSHDLMDLVNLVFSDSSSTYHCPSALAVLKVTLPEGTSSSEFLSPNYPNSFPDDDLMEWKFVVPPKHNATVVFLGQTQPQCLKKEPAVEYRHSNGQFAVVKKLSDPQPAQRRDSFTLILRNCEMNRIGDGSTGLSLRFKVSAKRRSLPGHYRTLSTIN